MSYLHSYDATLTVWPATPLPGRVNERLMEVGADLQRLRVTDGSVAAYRTRQGEIALELTFTQSQLGVTGLEAVLAELRLDHISYVAWDTKKDEIAGVGRSYDRRDPLEREFTVLAGGEPVLTATELETLERKASNDQLLLATIRRALTLPLPELAHRLNPAEVNIIITGR
jgi:hypothetical protein